MNHYTHSDINEIRKYFNNKIMDLTKGLPNSLNTDFLKNINVDKSTIYMPVPERINPIEDNIIDLTFLDYFRFIDILFVLDPKHDFLVAPGGDWRGADEDRQKGHNEEDITICIERMLKSFRKRIIEEREFLNDRRINDLVVPNIGVNYRYTFGKKSYPSYGLAPWGAKELKSECDGKKHKDFERSLHKYLSFYDKNFQNMFEHITAMEVYQATHNKYKEFQQLGKDRLAYLNAPNTGYTIQSWQRLGLGSDKRRRDGKSTEVDAIFGGNSYTDCCKGNPISFIDGAKSGTCSALNLVIPKTGRYLAGYLTNVRKQIRKETASNIPIGSIVDITNLDTHILLFVLLKKYPKLANYKIGTNIQKIADELINKTTQLTELLSINQAKIDEIEKKNKTIIDNQKKAQDKIIDILNFKGKRILGQIVGADDDSGFFKFTVKKLIGSPDSIVCIVPEEMRLVSGQTTFGGIELGNTDLTFRCRVNRPGKSGNKIDGADRNRNLDIYTRFLSQLTSLREDDSPNGKLYLHVVITRTFPYLPGKTYENIFVQPYPNDTRYFFGRVTPTDTEDSYTFTSNDASLAPVEVSNSYPILSQSYFKFLLKNTTDDGDEPERVKVQVESKTDTSANHNRQELGQSATIAHFAYFTFSDEYDFNGVGSNGINSPDTYTRDITYPARKAICDFGQSYNMFLKNGGYVNGESIAGQPNITYSNMMKKYTIYDNLIDGVIKPNKNDFPVTSIHKDLPAIALAGILLMANQRPHADRVNKNKNEYAHTAYDSFKNFTVSNSYGIISGLPLNSQLDIFDKRKRVKVKGRSMKGGSKYDELLNNDRCDFKCIIDKETKILSKIISDISIFKYSSNFVKKYNSYIRYIHKRNDVFGLNIDLSTYACVAAIAEEEGVSEVSVDQLNVDIELIKEATNRRLFVKNLIYDEAFYNFLIDELNTIDINKIETIIRYGSKININYEILVEKMNNEIKENNYKNKSFAAEQQKTIIKLNEELGTFVNKMQNLPKQDIKVAVEDGTEELIDLSDYIEPIATLSSNLSKSIFSQSESTLDLSELPASSFIDQEQARQMQRDIEIAATVPLPPEKDDDL